MAIYLFMAGMLLECVRQGLFGRPCRPSPCVHLNQGDRSRRISLVEPGAACELVKIAGKVEFDKAEVL